VVLLNDYGETLPLVMYIYDKLFIKIKHSIDVKV
jgi:hypothetical protein